MALGEGQTWRYFYLPKINSWVCAKNLQPSDLILTIAGLEFPIETVEYLNTPKQFYDLTTKNNHNFFVSNLGILVHNEPITLGLITIGSTKAAILAGYVAKVAFIGIMGYFFCHKSQNRKPTNPIFPSSCLQPVNDNQLINQPLNPSTCTQTLLSSSPIMQNDITTIEEPKQAITPVPNQEQQETVVEEKNEETVVNENETDQELDKIKKEIKKITDKAKQQESDSSKIFVNEDGAEQEMNED